MNSLAPTRTGDRPRPTIRPLTVLAVERVTPRMRRITFGGDALADFATDAPDDHVKLLFPALGGHRPAWLPSDAGSGASFPDDGPRPVTRDYTPARFDRGRLELAIEFVLHGDGPAATWAANAVPGDPLAVAGPRGSRPVPDDRDTFLFLGDETALPMIARHLAELRPGTRAVALVEIADRDEERHLPSAASVAVAFLRRDQAPAGRPDRLLAALRQLRLPRGDLHVAIAAEIDTARMLRRYLLDEEGVTRDRIRAAGYWRVGQPGAHARVDD